MWYVCDVLYAVLYVCVSCFVVRGCAVSWRYINACNCDMFSVVNVHFEHLKLCVFMFECMSVVVNVMFSLTSVMSPPPNDTAYTRWSFHGGLANPVQIVSTQAMGARLSFLGKPAMRTRWMAGNAPHKSGRCRD